MIPKPQLHGIYTSLQKPSLTIGEIMVISISAALLIGILLWLGFLISKKLNTKKTPPLTPQEHLLAELTYLEKELTTSTTAQIIDKIHTHFCSFLLKIYPEIPCGSTDEELLRKLPANITISIEPLLKALQVHRFSQAPIALEEVHSFIISIRNILDQFFREEKQQ